MHGEHEVDLGRAKYVDGWHGVCEFGVSLQLSVMNL